MPHKITILKLNSWVIWNRFPHSKPGDAPFPPGPGGYHPKTPSPIVEGPMMSLWVCCKGSMYFTGMYPPKNDHPCGEGLETHPLKSVLFWGGYVNFPGMYYHIFILSISDYLYVNCKISATWICPEIRVRATTLPKLFWGEEVVVNVVIMWLHISTNHDYLSIYQSTSQHDDEDAVILARIASLSIVTGVVCVTSIKQFQMHGILKRFPGSK